jgi:hypothetical protein
LQIAQVFMPVFTSDQAMLQFWGPVPITDLLAVSPDQKKYLTWFIANHPTVKTAAELSTQHGNTPPQLVTMFACLFGEALKLISSQAFRDMKWEALQPAYCSARTGFRSVGGLSPSPSKVLVSLVMWGPATKGRMKAMNPSRAKQTTVEIPHAGE